MNCCWCSGQTSSKPMMCYGCDWFRFGCRKAETAAPTASSRWGDCWPLPLQKDMCDWEARKTAFQHPSQLANSFSAQEFEILFKFIMPQGWASLLIVDMSIHRHHLS